MRNLYCKFAIFFLFTCGVYSQDFTSFRYNELDSAGWITEASGLIIKDAEGSEIIKWQVDYNNPGKIELFPTSMFPDN
jgi:hypothetical protein